LPDRRQSQKFDISQKAHSSADPFWTKLNASVVRKRNDASEAIDAPVSCAPALDHIGRTNRSINTINFG
jgi:hypothetical protein